MTRPAAAPTAGPSYDALLIIVQSVTGALSRAGLTDCDDPGEAVDVIRETRDARIATLEAAGKRVTDAFRAMGAAHGVIACNRARVECEASLVALDAALAKAGEQ